MNMYGVVLGFRVRAIDVWDQDLLPEFLKTRTIYGSFCQHFLATEKRCIVALFQTMFWNLELLRKKSNRRQKENVFFICQTKDAKLCILALFETIFWNF